MHESMTQDIVAAVEALDAAIAKLTDAATPAEVNAARAHVLAARQLDRETPPRTLAAWLDVDVGPFGSRATTLRRVVASCFGDDCASALASAETVLVTSTPATVSADVRAMLAGTFVPAVRDAERRRHEDNARSRAEYDRRQAERGLEAERTRLTRADESRRAERR